MFNYTCALMERARAELARVKDDHKGVTALEYRSASGPHRCRHHYRREGFGHRRQYLVRRYRYFYWHRFDAPGLSILTARRCCEHRPVCRPGCHRRRIEKVGFHPLGSNLSIPDPKSLL